MPVETRLQKVETAVAVLTTNFAGLKADVGGLAQAHHSFVEEWRARNQAEGERQLKQLTSARLSFPQIWAMIGTTVMITATILGGATWLIRSESGSVEQRLSGRIEAEAAKTSLSLARAQDAVNGANAQLATLARDFSAASVKIGLVEQTSTRNAEALRPLDHIDETLGRLDERIKIIGEARK